MRPDDLQRRLARFLADTGDDWNYILPEELHRRLQQGEAPFLLDNRLPEDFAAGHIPGAVNIFWLDLFAPGNLERIPRDREVIVVCYVGHTASQLLVLLKLLGFRARVLKYGMGRSPVPGVPVAGWLDFGYDVVRE